MPDQSLSKPSASLSLMDLPEEILLAILNYLDVPEFMTVTLVNQFLYRLSQDQKCWARKFIQQFNEQLPQIPELDLSQYPKNKNGFISLAKRYFQLQQQEFKSLLANPLLSIKKSQLIRNFSTQPFSFSQLEKNEHLLNKVNNFLIAKQLNEYKKSDPAYIIRFSGLDLTRIPPSLVEYLSLLKEPIRLVLSNNQLYFLPQAFQNLEKLLRIDLADNQFNHVPVQLLHLKNLQSIDLYENKITEWPKNLNMSSTTVDLRCNKLTHIPGKIEHHKAKELIESQQSPMGTCSSVISLLERSPPIIHSLCFLEAALRLMNKTTFPALTIGLAAAKLIRYREESKWEANKSTPDTLTPGKYRCYEEGRKARRWTPYLKSFFNRKLYTQKGRTLFLAGLNDAQSNQPPRKCTPK